MFLFCRALLYLRPEHTDTHSLWSIFNLISSYSCLLYLHSATHPHTNKCSCNAAHTPFRHMHRNTQTNMYLKMNVLLHTRLLIQRQNTNRSNRSKPTVCSFVRFSWQYAIANIYYMRYKSFYLFKTSTSNNSNNNSVQNAHSHFYSVNHKTVNHKMKCNAFAFIR